MRGEEGEEGEESEESEESEGGREGLGINWSPFNILLREGFRVWVYGLAGGFRAGEREGGKRKAKDAWRRGGGRKG